MNKNESIKCTVEQCKHHACSENYCTLNSITGRIPPPSLIEKLAAPIILLFSETPNT